MVVAPGAADRKAKKGFSGHVDRIDHPLVPELVAVQGRLVVDGSDGVESGADAGFEIPPLLLRNLVRTPQLDVVGPDLVSRDLLPDEAVERLVVIEGLDHVVAKAPRVGGSRCRSRSLRCRRSAQRRASIGPIARRSARTRAGGRSRSRRHQGESSCEKGRDLGGSGAAARADRRWHDGSRFCGPPRPPVPGPPGPAPRARKLSIGVWAHPLPCGGTSGRATGLNDHQVSPGVRSFSAGHWAPALIHSSSTPMSLADRGGDCKGIAKSPLMAHRPAQHARCCVAGNHGGTSLSAVQEAFRVSAGRGPTSRTRPWQATQWSLRIWTARSGTPAMATGASVTRIARSTGIGGVRSGALSISGAPEAPGIGVRRCGRDPAVQADCVDRIALWQRKRRSQPSPSINCGTRARTLLASGASNWPLGARDPPGTSLFREVAADPGVLGGIACVAVSQPVSQIRADSLIRLRVAVIVRRQDPGGCERSP